MTDSRFLILGLLPWASGICRLKSDTEHVFDCRYDGVLAPPDIRVPSWGAGSSFKLHLELAQLTKDAKRNASSCSEMEIAALVGYSSNYVALYEHGKLDHEGQCGIQERTVNFHCLEPAIAAPDIEIAINVESNRRAPVQVLAELQKTSLKEYHFAIPVGGKHGRYAFHVMTIPDDPAVDLWRFHFAAHHENASGASDAFDDAKREAITIYSIHESSPCVSSVVMKGGCLDPEDIDTCIGSVPISFLPNAAEYLKIAMHLSFTKKGAMTLGKGSLPALQPGRWIIFMICGELGRPCPATTVEVQSHGESYLWLNLLNGFVIIVLGTITVLVIVNAIYWFAYYALHQCSPDPDSRAGKQRLWPVMCGACSRGHIRGLGDIARFIAWPIPFFATFLSLMLAVFLATTMQFILGNYLIMVESGDRDVCFFNERCFYPGSDDALPLNNLLSNLAYFVAGVHVMCQAFCAETRCKKVARNGMVAIFKSMDPEELGSLSRERWNEVFAQADGNRNGRVSRSEWRGIFGTHYAFDFIDQDGNGVLELSEWDEAFGQFDRDKQEKITADDMVQVAMDSRRIDLRAFYAIGVALWGLGIGSMSYHVCPSLLTFQFDTCFMIPLANLFTLALLDWQASSSSETITSVKYIVYILTPFWLINFIGTWYDIKAFDINWLYWIFAALAIVWCVVVVMAGIRRIFQRPGRCGLWTKRILEFILIAMVVVSFLVPQVRQEYFSGTANFFLQLSVIVMVVVVSRQIYLEDLRFMTCEVHEVGARIIKNLYAAILLGCGAVAMVAFSEKVVIVEPGVTPAESHDANQDCVFSIFDLHDVWHFLSAIALALFAMLLLDVRVNSWARKIGIRVLFENLPPELQDLDSDYDDEEEDSAVSREDEPA